jgi:hypothetical protein
MPALGLSESFDEPVGGRVRGIAWPADVVPSYQDRIDNQIGGGIVHHHAQGRTVLPAPADTVRGGVMGRLT